MRITATQLRKNIYKLLDKAIEEGEPIEVDRNGVIVRLIPEKKSKFSGLQPHPKAIRGPVEFFDSIDWSKEWRIPE